MGTARSLSLLKEGRILPGATIGILGGGQLGRMMAMAAKRMGYRVIVLDPTPNSPAGQVADDQVTGAYADQEKAKELARRSAVVTVEFENIPASTLEALEPLASVHPSSRVVRIAQNRINEKAFLTQRGFPVPAFYPVHGPEDLRAAVASIGCPALLKGAAGGYDGKGQAIIQTPDVAEAASHSLGRTEAVLEELVPLATEVSVIVARNSRGETACYPASENTHTNRILDTAVMPGPVEPRIARDAQEIACAIAEELGAVGLLAVEFFVAKDGRLLVNELAPRPHNSGHQTLDGAVTSQFEQAVRAVCNLPLGSPDLLGPTAIANLLGDLWQGGEPDWVKVLGLPDVKLHLYGKAEPRPGRKMGHLAATAATPQAALQRVLEARSLLGRSLEGG